MKDISIEYEGEIIRLGKGRIKTLHDWEVYNGECFFPVSAADINEAIATIVTASVMDIPLKKEEYESVLYTLAAIRESLGDYLH